MVKTGVFTEIIATLKHVLYVCVIVSYLNTSTINRLIC